MSKIFIVLAMIYMHILDDYVLQGLLANLKQRSWWKQNYPAKMYRYDYIVALLMHSMSWSFMTLLPVAAYRGFNVGTDFLSVFLINALGHAGMDHAKANLGLVNLITDQTFHLLQILVTAACML